MIISNSDTLAAEFCCDASLFYLMCCFSSLFSLSSSLRCSSSCFRISLRCLFFCCSCSSYDESYVILFSLVSFFFFASWLSSSLFDVLFGLTVLLLTILLFSACKFLYFSSISTLLLLVSSKIFSS